MKAVDAVQETRMESRRKAMAKGWSFMRMEIGGGTFLEKGG